MAILHKLTRLRAADRLLLLKCLPLVAMMRAALWILPFDLTRRLVILLIGRAQQPRRPAAPPERIAWAVGAAARRIPAATCLTQALSLHVLCRRAGYDTQLRIGVTRPGNGPFKAHAWVELDGTVLIGGGAPASFLPLPPAKL